MKKIVLFGGVSSKEKVFFARQVAVMISSGVAIDNAINLIKLQTKNSTFINVLEQIHQDVEAGEALSAALSKHPKVFDPVFVAVVSSGETSGRLDRVLTHLADRMEGMEAFKSKIKSALAYPIFIILAMISVTIVMMIKVIPVLKQVFEESNAKLPWATRTLIAISNFIVYDWYILVPVLVVIVVVVWFYFARTQPGKMMWDLLKLKTPIVKFVSYDMYMARFTRTLGMLISAGIPIIQALKITSQAMNNRVYVRILRNVIAQVERGIPMSVPLEKEKYFLVLVPQMIMIGEQTGRLEFLMEKIADYYEGEVDTKIKTISSLIEPVTIVIVGIGVGFLIYSILYPIYSLVNVI